jgi:beta-lactamase class C
MNSSLRDCLEPLVVEAMRSYNVPGLVVACRHESGPIFHYARGTDAAGQALAPDALFPVASVTKLATALAVLRLVDESALALDVPLSTYLPEALAAQPGVTVRGLLAHTSGLPYDLDLSWTATVSDVRWEGFAAECLRTPLRFPPGTRVQYSNVAYGLLATIVERLTGQEFRRYFRSQILVPLGVEGYLGDEPPAPPATVLDVRGEYASTEYEPYNTRFWRSLALPWGGLVTTVAGALRIIQAFVPGSSSILTPSTADEAIANQTDGLPGGFLPPLVWRQCWWGLGPDLRGTKDPHWAPKESSPRTFGHAGASGALAYLDPTTRIAWAIGGTRTADNGWLLRWGPKFAATIIREFQTT